jgi:NTP pyrophosphatase (non-canonical NTP hydrolase)
MEINEFKKQILERISEISNLPNRKQHTKQTALIHLVEEIGEVAKQVMNEYHRPEKFDKENLGEELADVMAFIVLLSELYEIDISKEMEKSIKKVEGKIKNIKEKNKKNELSINPKYKFSGKLKETGGVF